MKRMYTLLSGALLTTGIVSSITSYRAWRHKELARLQAASTMIETKAGLVEYQQTGRGPAVLIAHGSPGGYDMSVAFAKLIDSSDFTFISVSRPGYLRTPLESGRSPEEQADLYVELLNKFAIQKAAIIGVSGGGPSSLQFAIRHPERCSGLVMISGVAQSYSEEELAMALTPFKRIFRKVYEKVIAFDPLLYLALPFARLQPTPSAAEDLLRSITMYHLRRAGYANDLEQFVSIHDYPLKNISAPTLIVHGIADDEVPFADAELMIREIPHARLMAISKGTHMVFYTHANTIMPVLRNFLHNL